ncbi:hypothetical protein AVEN_87591-1 [Araneus ventricosus]|uniref:Uncharacterized protein n=1 Tax=Araneus ventricosus TaxID=182803 RepID=A0A4Y2LRK3_ARAVE|nr:hypothetical protein AVEN_87591-1 [Araneus ventricosus]
MAQLNHIRGKVAQISNPLTIPRGRTGLSGKVLKVLCKSARRNRNLRSAFLVGRKSPPNRSHPQNTTSGSFGKFLEQIYLCVTEKIILYGVKFQK